MNNTIRNADATANDAALARANLRFLGGAGTVTGSKHLVKLGGQQILLDCGLFQGLKELRLRNWDDPDVDPRALDAVILSHAHLDHSGYLPRLVKNGFRGAIHCTSGTADLVRIVLLDSAHLQQEDAARANRYGYSKHKPALPLYTTDDAERTLEFLKRHPYGESFEVVPGVRTLFRRAGHILGSATVELEAALGVEPSTRGTFRLVFSGDLGRWNRPILRDPEFVPEADILLLESTYGDRTHGTNTEDEIARIITQAAQRGGAVIVPAFAIGRTQELIWTIRKLEEAGRLPLISVFIDSPMAINVTDLYCRHSEDHDLDMTEIMDEKRCPLCCKQYHLVRTPQESKALNGVKGPMVIIAGSGMATGGRVLHHLKQRLPDHRTTVLLAGYQAAGTRGRALQEGARELRIHNENIAVRAHVETVNGLSAHADQSELLRWLRGFKRAPKHTYLVHGESKAAHTLAAVIEKELGWAVSVANDRETVPLP